MDRSLALLTSAAVVIVTLTANFGLELGFVAGVGAEITAMLYLAALGSVVAWPSTSSWPHALAAAGALLFWGGRVVALTEAHLSGSRDLRTAAAVHLLAMVALLAHHWRANERIGVHIALDKS